MSTLAIPKDIFDFDILWPFPVLKAIRESFTTEVWSLPDPYTQKSSRIARNLACSNFADIITVTADPAYDSWKVAVGLQVEVSVLLLSSFFSGATLKMDENGWFLALGQPICEHGNHRISSHSILRYLKYSARPPSTSHLDRLWLQTALLPAQSMCRRRRTQEILRNMPKDPATVCRRC